MFLPSLQKAPAVHVISWGWFLTLFQQSSEWIKSDKLNDREEPKSGPVGVPRGTYLLLICVRLTEAGWGGGGQP